MNIYCSSDGTIIHVDPERVFQGSTGSNVVRFIGAFPHSAQVLMAYKLPNGAYTSPKLLSPVAELAEVQTPDGGKFSVWEGRIGATPKLDSNGNVMYDEKGVALFDLDYTITENYGTAYMQFHVYDALRSGTVNGVELAFGNAILATAMVEFEIEKGVPVIPPVVETEDAQALLTQILGVVSNTQTAYKSLEDDVARNTANVTAHGTAINELQADKVNKSGDTMTGSLSLVGSDGTMTITNKGFERSGVPFELPSGGSGKLVSDRQAITDLTFHIEEDTFAMVLAAYNGRGDIVYVKQIDLPIESMVVGGKYNDITHRIELTLQNGNVVSFPVDELVNGLISSSEKGQPNGVASLDAEGKVPKEQLPDDIGGGGSLDSSVLAEYVKFTDYASLNKAGVVKTIGGSGSGINVEAGIITIYPASKAEINNTFYYPAITSRNIGYATKHALVYPEKYTSVSTDWTDDDKAAACETVGATPIPKAGAENGAFIVLMPNGTMREVKLAYADYPSINCVPVYNSNKTIMVNNAVNDTDAPNWRQVITYVDGLQKFTHYITIGTTDEHNIINVSLRITNNSNTSFAIKEDKEWYNFGLLAQAISDTANGAISANGIIKRDSTLTHLVLRAISSDSGHLQLETYSLDARSLEYIEISDKPYVLIDNVI